MLPTDANDGEVLWREWLQQIQPVASVVPWMTGCGNHDCLWAAQPYRPPWAGYFAAGGDGGECGVPYSSRFWMPGEVALVNNSRESRNGTRNNLFWSMERAAVHVVMLSSEHDLREGSVQWRWLQSDLAKVDRRRTPWLVVGLHRPLYSSVIGGEALPETRGMREALEPLLLRYRVDLVLCGHYHQYERSCRLAAGSCDERGPVHMTVVSSPLSLSSKLHPACDMSCNSRAPADSLGAGNGRPQQPPALGTGAAAVERRAEHEPWRHHH